MKDTNISRRRFAQAIGSGTALSMVGGGAALSLAGCATGPTTTAERKLGRVLVVGGGFGGATAAKYLKKWGGPGLEVMLVERQTAFVSCPLSNLVLGGSRKIADLTVPYDGLRRAGVIVVNDEVEAIDPAKRSATFRKLANQSFDRIVVSPGIEFDFDSVQGLDAEAQKTILHAWKAGPQTVALRAQLEAMPDGGVYVLSIPKSPYRCPRGPTSASARSRTTSRRPSRARRSSCSTRTPTSSRRRGCSWRPGTDRTRGSSATSRT